MSDGDRSAQFTRLVSEHSRALLRYTLRRLDDRAACEDVVAETFLIAWRRWDDLPSPDKELPWLYGIAFRVLSNHRRSRDRRDRLRARLLMERGPNASGDDVAGLDPELVLRALGQLREQERELLELVYWEKLTYRDIALAVGVSENAVGIRITRAKKNLRAFLAPLFDETPRLSIFSGEAER
jgi:RNA polymerase sigma-70 factor (ECF subfamily)